jgi:dethiobiotin synthetase
VTDRGLAVVGTDTGVGKTVVTAALVAGLRERGHEARGVKPVQTGYPPDDDADVVAATAGTDDAATCLDRLEPPLAPRVAAEQEGRTLEYDRIRSACRRELAAAPIGVLEGVGGLRVPLAGDREVIDLVADCDVPALVVARSDLGTLNHTTLTVAALRCRDVPVAGVVCNEYAGASVAERTNPAELERLTDCPVCTVPPVDGDDDAAVARGVADHLSLAVFPPAIAAAWR